MIQFTSHFYKNILVSLSCFSNNDVWQHALRFHLLILPLILIAFFCWGAVHGFRTEKTHGRFHLFLEIFFVIAFLVVGFFLDKQPHAPWPGVLFLLFFSMSLYFTGSRSGSFVSSLRHGPIAIYAIITVFVVVLIFLFLSFSAPSISFSKEGLKKTYNSLTGQDPTSEDKSSFWKSTTGEENPSESKKNQVWDKPDKK